MAAAPPTQLCRRLGDRNDPAWLRAVVALFGVRTNAADAEYDVIKREAHAIAEPADIGNRLLATPAKTAW